GNGIRAAKGGLLSPDQTGCPSIVSTRILTFCTRYSSTASLYEEASCNPPSFSGSNRNRGARSASSEKEKGFNRAQNSHRLPSCSILNRIVFLPFFRASGTQSPSTCRLRWTGWSHSFLPLIQREPPSFVPNARAII